MDRRYRRTVTQEGVAPDRPPGTLHMKFLTAPAVRLLALSSILLVVGGLLTFGPDVGWTADAATATPAESTESDSGTLVGVPAGGALLGFGLWGVVALLVRSWRTPALWGTGMGTLGLTAGSVLELVRHPQWNTSLITVAIVAGIVGLWNPIAAVIHGRLSRASQHAGDEAHEDEEDHENEED